MRAITIEGQSRFDKLKFLVSPVEFQEARLDTAGPIGKLPASALLRKWLGLSVIALVSAFSASADQQSADNTAVADAPLSPDELKSATSVDALTVPTPGEFFKAIEKKGNLIGPLNIGRPFR